MPARKYLFLTSTPAAQESLSVFTTQLLREGHQVAVMGPTELQLPEGVDRFSRIVESQEWDPTVIIPLDDLAASKVIGCGAFKGSKARMYQKEALAYQLSSCRSFGLSLVAKTGMPVIPYHVVANEGDMLRLQAKMGENGEPWHMFRDHPACLLSDPHGNLATPALEGEIVQVAFLISGRNLVTPAFAYYNLQGLLPRGGIKDWRGCVVIPTWNDKLAFIGNKIQLAASSIGASGFVFVDLLFPAGKRGKASVFNITLTPPQGFLAAVFLSGMTGFGVGDALHQVAGNKEFFLRTELMKAAFAFLVTDQHTGQEGYPIGDQWLEFPRELHSYYRGYYVSNDSEIPDELWEIRPTAEVKLDGQGSLDYAISRLEYFRLTPRELDNTTIEHVKEEEETNAASEYEPQRFDSNTSSSDGDRLSLGGLETFDEPDPGELTSPALREFLSEHGQQPNPISDDYTDGEVSSRGSSRAHSHQ